MNVEKVEFGWVEIPVLFFAAVCGLKFTKFGRLIGEWS